MKKKHPYLLKITAIFLIIFILGGYFSMLSRFLGQDPWLSVQYLYFIGVFGSFFCAIIWAFFYLVNLFKGTQ